jgi:hypothetical protein
MLAVGNVDDDAVVTVAATDVTEADEMGVDAEMATLSSTVLEVVVDDVGSGLADSVLLVVVVVGVLLP